MIRHIQTIDAMTFAPYGNVIEFNTSCPDDPLFEVVCSVPSRGWRIALYRVKRRSTEHLESHPDSRESFEPLSGSGLLLAGKPDRPEDYEVFLLDKPVCLHAGVWHQLISLGGPCTVKITENDEVSSQFHQLPRPVETALITGFFDNENAQ